MNLRRFLGVVAGLSVAALGVREALVGDEKPPQVGDVALHPEKVTPLLDGGSGYTQEMRTADGGRVVRLVSPSCVRRLSDAGVNACRRALSDGGVVDPGALNRFSADAGVGTRCQLVACSVFEGESADVEETVIVERSRDAGVAKEGAGK